jgi:hypothetical protein
MPFEKFSSFSFNHADQQDDLYKAKTSAEIKQDFDSRGEQLKIKLNDLIDQLQSIADGDSGADNIKATSITGLTGTTVQSLLESLKQFIDAESAGLQEEIHNLDNLILDVNSLLYQTIGNLNTTNTNVTKVEQDSISRDNSHQNSLKAHKSENIEYSGSLVDQTNVKGALESIIARVNNIVSQSGTSNTEIVDARKPSEGAAYTTLKARLDATDAGLADIATEKADKTELTTTNNTLALKADKSYVDLNKRDKSVKLTQVDLSEELISQIAGTAAVNAVPADKSVTPEKTDFLESMTLNLVNINALTDGYIDGTTGAVITASDSKVSDFIEVTEGETYSTNAGSKTGGYYNANKQFVQSIPWNATKPYVVPTGLGIKYIRAAFTSTQWAAARIFKGTTLYDYVPYTDDFQMDSKIKVLDENMKGTFTFPIDIKQAGFFSNTKNIFDKAKVTKEASISNTTGAVVAQTGTTYCASDFMSCKSSTFYTKSGTRHVAFYDSNKVFISGIASGVDSKTFTTPSNAVYIRVTILSDATGENLDQYMVYEGSALPLTYLPPYELTYDEGKKSPLKKKKWVSYGDSLTQMNVWQPTVAEKLGMTSVVRGIGSTTATEIGSLAYVSADGTFVDKPTAWGGTTDTPPAGTTTIYSSLSNDQRIATIPTDAEVITFMAGTNDMNMSKSITNNIDFADVSTFKSAFAIALKKIQLRCPRARIFTVTPPQSQKGTTANNAGHTPRQYADAIKEVSLLYGVPCIDLFHECGWNEWNMSIYLTDGVHPYSDTGGARMAEVIYKGMNGLV